MTSWRSARRGCAHVLRAATGTAGAVAVLVCSAPAARAQVTSAVRASTTIGLPATERPPDAVLNAQPDGQTPQPDPPPSPPHSATSVSLPAQGAAGSEERDSVYDRIWQRTGLYRNDANRVVQRVMLTGRYQHEFATVSADQGHHDEWNVRRMRLGSKVTMFRTFTFHGEVELNPQEADPLYVRITDFSLQWSRSRQLALTVGKQGAPFTMDGSTSSKELLTIDRSNVSNNMWFTQEYVPGVSVSGTIVPWVYRAGVYSAGRANREFGELNGGAFLLGVLGYDFSRRLGVSEAILAGHYVYQHPDADNTFTRPLEHIVSLNFKLAADRWGLRTDLAAARGHSGQSDLRGVMAMPFFNATDRLQIVARYTHVASADPNGVRLGTYENDVVAGRGDRYRELYLGANYYLYAHKLKLQSGVQLGDMNDRAGDGGAYSGVSWTTGIRVGW